MGGDYNEIKAIGGKKSTLRTPEQTDTARFYAVISEEDLIQILFLKTDE